MDKFKLNEDEIKLVKETSKNFSVLDEKNKDVNDVKERLDQQEIKERNECPTIEKYKDKLKKFLKGKEDSINLPDCDINDNELKNLFKELSVYKGKNLINNIKTIDLSRCKKLINPVFTNLSSLTNLNFCGCENLQGTELENIASLKELVFHGCKSLTDTITKNLPQSIVSLDFMYCDNLVSPTFVNLGFLKELNLLKCSKLVNPSFLNLQSLENLCLFGCESLITPSFINLQSIETIDIRGCQALVNPVFINTNKKSSLPKDILIEFEQNLSESVKLDTILDYFTDKEIKIGVKMVKTEFPKHINVFSGLIKTIKNTSKEEGETNNSYFDRIQLIYEKNLSEFISKGKEQLYDVKEIGGGKEELTPKSDTIVFSIFDKDDDAFIPEGRVKSNNYFQTLGKDFKNYNVSEVFDKNGVMIPGVSNELNKDDGTIKTSEEIINDIQNTIKENPKSQIIITMAGHGREDGSMSYNGIKFTKEHFAILLNLGPNVHLNITSCMSGYKDDDTNYFEGEIKSLPNYSDNNLGSLFLDSSLQTSAGGNGTDSSEYNFYKALGMNEDQLDKEGNPTYFADADYDGNGVVSYHEAVIYRNLNYNHSLTPTVLDGVEIAESSSTNNVKNKT